MAPVLYKIGRRSTPASTPPQPSRAPIRRALLIAIAYGGKDNDALRTPHRDARDWKALLIEKYGYVDGEITMMLDAIGVDSRLVPSRDNILREIDAFVEGVLPGDRLMFYYSGHSLQFESESMHEEDNMDEALLPYHDIPKQTFTREDVILDNELRERLVKPLKVGVNLHAVLDSCHSATLFDLDHYMCNCVYFPWISKGPRDMLCLRRARVVRRNGYDVQWVGDELIELELSVGDTASSVGTEETVRPHVEIAPEPMHKDKARHPERKGSGDSKASGAASIGPRGRKLLRRLSVILSATKTKCKAAPAVPTITITRANTMDHPQAARRTVGAGVNAKVKRPCRGWTMNSASMPGVVMGFVGNVAEILRFRPRADSPESLLECDGWCREREARTGKRKLKANVITISACQDGQRTWESRSGLTMTQALITSLRAKPHPVLHDLVHEIGHELHNRTTRKLHTACQKRIDRFKKDVGEDVWKKVVIDKVDVTGTNFRPDYLEIVNGADPQLGSMNVLDEGELWNP